MQNLTTPELAAWLQNPARGLGAGFFSGEIEAILTLSLATTPAMDRSASFDVATK